MRLLRNVMCLLEIRGLEGKVKHRRPDMRFSLAVFNCLSTHRWFSLTTNEFF